MQTAEIYKICADLAAPAGSMRHYSLRFVETDKRYALSALYAFQHEVMAIPVRCNDQQIAVSKLIWWRTEIKKVFDNELVQHPVTQALQCSIGFFSEQRQRFQNVLNAVESDLSVENYATAAELIEFLQRSSGEIEIIAANVLSPARTEMLDYARHLGIGLQLFDGLLSLRQHLKAGLLYISEETLQAHKVNRGELARLKLTDASRQLIAAQLNIAAQYWHKAEQLLKVTDRECHASALIMIRLQAALKILIEAENYDILSQKVALTPINMLWITMQTIWSL